jgi:pimeloyl-ACP methyl ester carboxylesterase
VVGSVAWSLHATAAQLVRRLGATLLVVDGAGRPVHETHPEPVNRAILDLCARVAAGTATGGE